MKKIASCLFVLCITSPLYAQVVPPKDSPIKPPPVAKPIVPLTLSAKAGELVILDAKAAKGKVSFRYDKKTFDPKHALLLDKTLVLTAPSIKESKAYSVVVISWADETEDECTLTVQGTDGPPVPDPGATPVEKLAVKVDALTKLVRDGFAAQEKRLTALEQIKPIPPPIPPVDAFQKALQDAYTLDGRPAVQLAQLTSIYRLSSSVVNEPLNKTPADVFGQMHRAIASILKEPKVDAVTMLPNTRKAIAAELDKVLPLGPASVQPLDLNMRATIAGQFSRVQKALEGITP